LTVWLTGWDEIDGVDPTPVPVIAMDSTSVETDGATGPLPPASCGVGISLFVIKSSPEASPIAVGANFVIKVALCPSAIFNGSDGPFTLKPLPDAAACVIVMGADPEFERVRVRLVMDPIATSPKVMLVGLAVKFPENEVHPNSMRASKAAGSSGLSLR
jgi:hypothetical protein